MTLAAHDAPIVIPQRPLLEHLMNHPACKLSLIALACAALTACGGGGDDAGGANGSDGLADITASNYRTVASEAAGAMSELVKLARSSNQTASALSVDAHSPRALTARALETLQQANPLVTAQAVKAASLTCDTGTKSLAVDDKNNNSILDGGDVVTSVDKDCLKGGVLTSGLMRITVNQTPSGDLSAGSSNYAFDTTYAAENFTSTQGGVTTVVDGGMRARGVRTGVNTGRDELTMERYSVSTTKSGVTTSVLLAGATTQVDYAPLEMTIRVTAAITTPIWGGKLNLNTVTPFRLDYYNGAYPRAGQAKVTGTNAHSVTVKALNSAQAQVSADLDGNGSDDLARTSFVNWSSLY
jgi:hypothetical protein